MMTLASSISYSIQNTTTQKHIHTLTRTRFHQLRILFACIIRAVCRMHMLQKTCFSVIQSDRTIHRNRIARTRHEFAWVYVNAKHDQTYGNVQRSVFFYVVSLLCAKVHSIWFGVPIERTRATVMTTKCLSLRYKIAHFMICFLWSLLWGRNSRRAEIKMSQWIRQTKRILNIMLNVLYRCGIELEWMPHSQM